MTPPAPLTRATASPETAPSPPTLHACHPVSWAASLGFPELPGNRDTSPGKTNRNPGAGRARAGTEECGPGRRFQGPLSPVGGPDPRNASAGSGGQTQEDLLQGRSKMSVRGEGPGGPCGTGLGSSFPEPKLVAGQRVLDRQTAGPRRSPAFHLSVPPGVWARGPSGSGWRWAELLLPAFQEAPEVRSLEPRWRWPCRLRPHPAPPCPACLCYSVTSA